MNEDFKRYHGGGNPVPGKKVRVIYRGSNVPAKNTYDSDKLDWSSDSNGSYIFAYQPVETNNA